MPLTRYHLAALNSAAQHRAHMRRTGLTYAGARLWQDDEEAAVRRHWPDVPKLISLLPWRTAGAIRKRAQRLKLVKPRRVWRDGEFGQMRPPYEGGVRVADILPILHEKTARQVYGKASSRRVRRPRRPPQETGIPLVDAIRNRAFKEGLTMRDLDFLARGAGYFTRPRTFRSPPIRRALTLLGGVVTVRFEESD